MKISKVNKYKTSSYFIIIPKRIINSKKIKPGDCFMFVDDDKPKTIIMKKVILSDDDD